MLTISPTKNTPITTTFAILQDPAGDATDFVGWTSPDRSQTANFPDNGDGTSTVPSPNVTAKSIVTPTVVGSPGTVANVTFSQGSTPVPIVGGPLHLVIASTNNQVGADVEIV